MNKKPNRPVIAMSKLGIRGRFGNQVFQYAFMRIYCSRYSLKLQTGRWVGQYLFGHRDPAVSRKFPMIDTRIIREYVNKHSIAKAKKPPFANVDLIGQFMLHTRHFRPYKSYFRSLFRPVPKIKRIVADGMRKLRRKGKTIVGIHIRRGDFLNYKNHRIFVCTPVSWYVRWLEQIWPTLKDPVLFIASDDLDSVVKEFKRFRPVTSKDLVKHFPNDPSYYPDPAFYPDFYFLTQCDAMAISNSSFSFAASLLNRRCKIFVRPHPIGKLVPYDPWNSHVKVKFPVKASKKKKK